MKKDTRPFVVSLESGDVTVLGTSFGVSAYPGYPNYTTLVREVSFYFSTTGTSCFDSPENRL